MELVKEAHEAVGSLDTRSYTTLIKGCAMHGQMEAAMDVLDDMAALNIPPNAVGMLLTGQ